MGMKVDCLIFYALLPICGMLAAAETAPNTARVVGVLPDGTPPPPEPPKPKFIVPAEDILESKTFPQGGRMMTVQRIAPIDLPFPTREEAAINPSTPAVQKQIRAFTEEHPHAGFLFIGATVYQTKDGAARTYVTLWPQGQGEPIGFWSSADFALLSGFVSFIGSDGKIRSIMMAWGVQEVPSFNVLTEPIKNRNCIPKLPDLGEGKATFSITSGKATVEILAAIQSLHDLYNNEHDRLQAAYLGREKARIAQEAELKAHPPKPKDIVLSFWRTEAPAAEKEADQ